MLSLEEKNAVIDLFPFLGNKPIVFDVGSNKGMWSDVILDEFPNCELHLFEPNDKLLSFTEIKYEYKDNVTFNKLLAYKANIEMPFHFFENFNNELSSVYVDENWEKEGLPLKVKTVRACMLDTYCRIHSINKIDLLKIDCEGSDIDVLIGTKELITLGKIGVIQIEYSEHWKRGGHLIDELFEIAEIGGYKIYRYINDNFWEVKTIPEAEFHDNYYLTKYEIHNYSVGGWGNEFIKNTFELDNLDLVLEVGAFEGMTTKYICENLLNHANPDARVVCVDPMEDYYIEGDTEHPYFRNQYQRFLRNTRGLPVELKKGKSKDELPKLHQLRFGLIYIDGDHRKESVYFDCCWAFAICKHGGHILIDDYNWRPETREGIDKFLEEFNGFYDIVVKDYQVMIKKVTNRYNSLTETYYL